MPAESKSKETNVPMHCLQCEYDLRGLDECRCPECGRKFDPADKSSFSIGGRRVRRRHILVFYLACLVGTIVIGIAGGTLCIDWWAIITCMLIVPFVAFAGQGLGLLAVLIGLTMIVAFAIRPNRVTAGISIAGFLAWLYGGYVVYQIIISF